jgi:CheY-like chemotaxis protein
MVRQILTFARGVDGQRLLVNPQYLLRDIQKIARETFRKDLQVEIAAAPALWKVVGDATQLHQVLLNLCVNARDAMPNGGAIKITAENLILDAHYAAMHPEVQPGPYIVIEVLDHGMGMTAKTLEKIFDPFFTTKEIGKGTGLGLSTSLAIVRSHSGFIRVYSEVGKGSSFKVHLPADTGLAEDFESPASTSLPRGSGELILVIDDEHSIRTITQQTLEAFGYRCLLATDGADAVALYTKNRAEVAGIITDLMMPVMDGPTAVQIMRKLNPKLPVIATSGISSQGHVTKFARREVKHFLPKPYTAETLLLTLKEVLSGAA